MSRLHSYGPDLVGLTSDLLNVNSSHRSERVSLSTERNNAKFTICIPSSTFVKKIQHIVPVSMCIPHVWPNVYRSILTIKDQAGVLLDTLTLPGGNYTAQEIVDILNVAGLFITFTLDALTGVLTVSYAAAGAVTEITVTCEGNKNTNLNVDGGYNDNLNRVMGLPWVIPVSVPNQGTIIPMNLPNMQPVCVVHVHLDNLVHGHFTDSGAGTSNNTLLTIPVGTCHGTYLHWECKDPYLNVYDTPRNTSLDQMTVRLTDENGTQLFIPNSYDVSLVLRIYHAHDDTHAT